MFNNVSRRSLVVSAAAAGAAFGLNGRVELLPSALAQDAAWLRHAAAHSGLLVA